MAYLDVIIVLALAQFIFLGIKVGSARGKFGVAAPAITGNPAFERVFRVHQNTLEQLIVFVPACYGFFHYWKDPEWLILIPGLIFIIGRFMYSSSYSKDAAKRGPGFILTILSNVFLILGTFIGALKSLVMG